VIYKGLRSGVTRERFAQAIREGNTAEMLAAMPVSPGECHFIPAGVVHTLGAGLLIAEVQTPSDTTYRVFDWNRVDDSGKPRPLHIEEALESIHFDVTPDKLPVTTVGRLIDCEYFKVDKGHRTEGGEVLLSRGLMRTLIFLSGGGTIRGEPDAQRPSGPGAGLASPCPKSKGKMPSPQAEPVDFTAGDCLIIPAAFEGAMRFDLDTEYLTVTI
jgi:mannose-6-phosphate isomerase